MSTERFQQRANDLRRAVARLVEACEQPFNTFVRDSAIQRFEFCWELAWKTLKLRLEVVGIDALTPRDVFQAALQNGLIHDGNLWSDAQKMRNLTSHTYDELLAQKVYEFLLESGQGIFKQLAVDVAQWQTETP